MTSCGGVYEFVVAGSFGPVLRSMLSDLDIGEREVETTVRLTNAGEDELLSVLSAIAGGDRDIERVVIDGE